MQAYRRVIDEWRAADLRLDLSLALLERAWLLGSVDEQAAYGLEEAQAVFAAMGAEGLIARLEVGAGRMPDGAADRAAEKTRLASAGRVPG